MDQHALKVLSAFLYRLNDFLFRLKEMTRFLEDVMYAILALGQSSTRHARRVKRTIRWCLIIHNTSL